jgi:hypothetical protein
MARTARPDLDADPYPNIGKEPELERHVGFDQRVVCGRFIHHAARRRAMPRSHHSAHVTPGHGGRLVAGLAVAAVVLAGCMTTSVSLESRSPGPVRTVTDPHGLAASEAAHTLGSFKPPTGAARLRLAPSTLLRAPPLFPGTRYLIDQHRLWRTSGDMDGVVLWLKRHAQSKWVVSSSGTSGDGAGVEMTFVGFTLPSPGAFSASSQVFFSVAPDGPNHVAVRMDVQEVWIPTRPNWSYVSTKAIQAVITAWPLDGASPRIVTTDAASTVASLRALANSLHISTVGVTHCGESGQRFQLEFSGPGTPDVTIAGDSSECPGIYLSVNGHSQLVISDPGRHLAFAILKVAQ